jgi:hypothetical protein
MYTCRGKETLTGFEKVDQLTPSFPFSPTNLCWSDLLLGRYEGAFGEAQKALERSRQGVVGQYVALILLVTM